MPEKLAFSPGNESAAQSTAHCAASTKAKTNRCFIGDAGTDTERLFIISHARGAQTVGMNHRYSRFVIHRTNRSDKVQDQRATGNSTGGLFFTLKVGIQSRQEPFLNRFDRRAFYAPRSFSMAPRLKRRFKNLLQIIACEQSRRTRQNVPARRITVLQHRAAADAEIADVARQHVGMDAPAGLLPSLLEGFQKAAPVGVVAENGPPVVAASHEGVRTQG